MKKKITIIHDNGQETIKCDDYERNIEKNLLKLLKTDELGNTCGIIGYVNLSNAVLVKIEDNANKVT